MQEGVSASTVVRYLLGNRRAIDSLMDCPRAVWLGLLFVTSAGFAREYDAESLLHEPWYLLIPIAASLVTSFLLYCLLSVVALNSGAKEERFWTLYVAFLTLYWMTAPLAWLYALPVERFLPPLQAAQVNYGLLAIVSMWRVLLITRAASTFFSAPVVPVFWIVMLFADSIVVIASFALPQPVLQVMSGVRLNPLDCMLLRRPAVARVSAFRGDYDVVVDTHMVASARTSGPIVRATVSLEARRGIARDLGRNSPLHATATISAIRGREGIDARRLTAWLGDDVRTPAQRLSARLESATAME